MTLWLVAFADGCVHLMTSNFLSTLAQATLAPPPREPEGTTARGTVTLVSLAVSRAPATIAAGFSDGSVGVYAAADLFDARWKTLAAPM